MRLGLLKKIFVAAIIASGFLGVKADEPFRLHRYDSFRATPVTENSIVFFGNSITNMNEWRECFGDNPNIINRGNSGGLSGELLNNVESLIAGHPAKVFIGIGTNDIGTAGLDKPELIAGKIRAIVERFAAESPATKVYVQSILPSTNGSRTVAKIQAVNTVIKREIEAAGATYVDLFNDMMAITTGEISYDRLHITAKGYKIWCDKIAPLVGTECSYPATFTENASGLGQNSFGMRSTYWSVQSVKANDVLFIGDEMVHGGEWAELLNCPDVKNRGTNWGYGGLTLAQWKNCMPAIFATNTDRKVAPRMVILHMGLSETNGTDDIANAITAYRDVINTIRTYAPASTTKIVITSQLPQNDANKNTTRVLPMNTQLQALAAEIENAEYVDICTPLMTDANVANTTMFTSNYVYGRGYNAIARILAPVVGNGAHALSAEEFEAHYAKIQARTALGNVIESIKNYSEGSGLGQYPAQVLAPIKSKLQEANTLLAASDSELSAIQALATELNAALTTARAGLNQPTGWSQDAPEKVIVFLNNRSGLYCTETANALASAPAVSSRASQWKLIPRGDQTFDIQNALSGNYVSPSAANNSQLTTSAEKPATGWRFAPTQTPASYMIVNGTAQFNTTTSALENKVYNWGSGTNTSDLGCQYFLAESELLPAPEPVTPGVDNSNPDLSMVDIPMNGKAYVVPANLAQIVLKGGNEQTVAIDYTINTLATANKGINVIVSSCDSADVAGETRHYSLMVRSSNFGPIYIGDNGLEGWYTRGGTTTGRHKMVMTLSTTDGYRYYFDSFANVVSNGTITSANAGAYGLHTFASMPGVNTLTLGGSLHKSDNHTNTPDGTIHSIRFYNRILSPEELTALTWDGITGVEGIQMETPANASNAIYDLFGRQHNENANLPAGIYIRNGKKFVVR